VKNSKRGITLKLSLGLHEDRELGDTIANYSEHWYAEELEFGDTVSVSIIETDDDTECIDIDPKKI